MVAPPDRVAAGLATVAGLATHGHHPQLAPHHQTEVGVATHGRPADHCCPLTPPRPAPIHDGSHVAVEILPTPPEKQRWADVGIDEGTQSNVSTANGDRAAASDTSDEWAATSH